MRISDWSSDVCSSDLGHCDADIIAGRAPVDFLGGERRAVDRDRQRAAPLHRIARVDGEVEQRVLELVAIGPDPPRSEEHTSELQSLMRISYAVFCLKKKITQQRM